MPGQKRPEGLLTDADLRAAVKARVQAQLAGLWREPQPGDPVDVEIPGVAGSVAFLETQAAALRARNGA